MSCRQQPVSHGSKKTAFKGEGRKKFREKAETKSRGKKEKRKQKHRHHKEKL